MNMGPDAEQSRAGGPPGSDADFLSGEATVCGLLARALREGRLWPAILAPGRQPLSYSQLAQVIHENLRASRNAGMTARDRVAIVLPGGPELAVALLWTMIGGTAAPLNPAYSEEEFDFYLADLEARALVIQAGADNPSRKVAKARGIPIIDLYPEVRAQAGSFRVDLPAIDRPSADGLPGPEDTALLLHTSGSTSKPKLVPLTQANLYFSAINIGTWLGLTPGDCCLNVMPLFHVHGLVAGLLSSLAAGASVVCPPGFAANEFFVWMRNFSPTWYTAVPTIHQSILARSVGFAGELAAHRLRFIRSCSASLSPSVMSDLERRFRVPVVEAYGMTEASHQMACNPLPPQARKPGSVGLPTGIEIAVLGEEGDHLPTGESGEIAIRGRTVTPGYLNNREANARALCDGWLRTGDIGYFDADGYLFLSGRSKEMINKAGEKISPRDVEEALLTHPDVAEAAAFGMQDERLGEEVAAAVVLKTGATSNEVELRSHTAGRIAHFKVPRRVLFVDEIPKGPTGKIQRIGLGERLGLCSGARDQPGDRRAATTGSERRTGTEEHVLRMMQKSRGGPIGFDENFFEAGGDSIQAAVFLAEVRKHFGADISIASFTVHSTARDVSRLVAGSLTRVPAAVVPIKQSGSRIPFICVHPHDGRVTLFYPMAEFFDVDQPFYALQSPSGEDLQATAGGIERMAGRYADELKKLRPEAPYLIGGYCFGALVALEMARILARRGDKVAFLALIDSYAPGGPTPSAQGTVRGALYRSLDQARRVRPLLAYLSHLPPAQRRRHLVGLLRSLVDEWSSLASRSWSPGAGSYSLPGRENDKDWRYHPAPYEGPAVLFRPTREPVGFRRDPAMGWRSFIAGGLEIENVRGYHRSLIFSPWHQMLADRLNYHLRRCQQAS